MRAIKITKSRRCRDGTTLIEVSLDEQVSMQFLSYLEHFGTVKILADLDPPFYSFSMPHFFHMKGMVDDTGVHVRFTDKDVPCARDLFDTLLHHYDAEVTDIQAMTQCIREKDLSGRE